MPLRLPDKLPAIELLKEEGIFAIDDIRANSQDIRPLKIAVLNLMPLKIVTETDLVRVLSNTPLQVEMKFMKLRTHESKNTSIEHMDAFYEFFDEAFRDNKFDGLIVTGAPVEQLDFEDVEYWDEIKEIFEWSKTHVTSTLYICWAAQAGLYYHFGVPKYPLDNKMFGVFEHDINNTKDPLFRGFDDRFFAPHSRHTEVWRSDIDKVDALRVIAEGPESGVSMVMAREGREFFITGHLEYAPDTLDKEYKRDAGKRDDVELPKNYYRDNDPAKGPLVTWRSHANLLFNNWINYYVYQETPYNINEIK